MWPSKAPQVTATEAASACASGVQDKDLAARLVSSFDEFEQNNKALRAAAKAHDLHTLTASSFPVTALSGDELKNTYSNQLGREGRPASEIRHKLISSAAHGLCCYCQYGAASTLDHFLPKDSLPTLSIDPWNLVPACSRCNHKIGKYVAVGESGQFLHPYEMPVVGRWLFASTLTTGPTVVTFEAQPDPSLPVGIRQRIANEFDKLGLADLFSVVVGPDLAETGALLTRLFPTGRSFDVQSYLFEMASAGWSLDPNSRRAALYEALANSPDYCAGAYTAEAPPSP